MTTPMHTALATSPWALESLCREDRESVLYLLKILNFLLWVQDQSPQQLNYHYFIIIIDMTDTFHL